MIKETWIAKIKEISCWTELITHFSDHFLGLKRFPILQLSM